MINYDYKVKDFIKEWEYAPDNYFSCIKQALTGLIIPFIYNSLRQTQFLECLPGLKKTYLLQFNKLPEILIHTLWYTAWSIKWLLFICFFSAGRKIIITSFFKRKSYPELIKQIRGAKDERRLFINFSVLYDIKKLAGLHFYCYPYTFYKKTSPGSNLNLTPYFIKLYTRHFNQAFLYPDKIRIYTDRLTQIYSSFNNLLDYLRRRNKCICLLQDCDYLGERVIFTKLCNQKNIHTFSFDHSIMLNDHLYLNTSSDIKFTWGKYQSQRLRNNAETLPAEIIISGKPGTKIKHKHNSISKHFWIYFLPAFQDAHMQSFYRSYSDTINRIQTLKNIVDLRKNIRFLIKPHPSDNLKFNSKLTLSKKPTGKLITKCSLAFVEDSTLSLELLASNIKVIYFTDRNGKDNLQNKKFKNDYTICREGDDLEEKINEAIAMTINKKNRAKMYKYYFGTNRIENYKISDQINLILHAI